MIRVLTIASVAAIALVLAACTSTPPPRVTPSPRAAGRPDSPVRVAIGTGAARRVVAAPLEEYVLASVLAEFVPGTTDSPGIRTMFAVQAIVARTYAVAARHRHRAEGFDLCATTHCQLVDLDGVSRSRWADVARGAVNDTRGLLLWYGGHPATALYHSDCGGYRAAADEVWGGQSTDYLQAGPDPLPRGYDHVTWRFAIDRDRLRDALNTSERTAVGARLDTIEVYRRDGSGRAALVLLNGERAPLVRGEEFRSVVSRVLGARALRSARFEVAREGTSFVFQGQGFGHGVGLCQRGALARAATGESIESILAFYFPGTTVAPAR